MPETSAHILVVDDDPQIRTMLRRCLEGEGYRVSEAADADGVMSGLAKQPDLITLDLNLGSSDGLNAARDVRRQSDVPIIMITGKGDTIDRVVGLELGADDYIAKPFHLREVLARVRTVLRRSQGTDAGAVRSAPESEPGRRLAFDGYELDLGRRRLCDAEGREVDLTSGEFDLLAMFAQRPQRVLSRDQIMDLLKGHDWAPTDRSIDNMVARLRKRFAPEHGARLIKSVRGVGYSFTPDT